MSLIIKNEVPPNPHVLCGVTTAVVAGALLLSTSCGAGAWRSAHPQPHMMKALAPAPFVTCTAATGHTPGTWPVVLGGTCACAPTESTLRDYQAHGRFLAESLAQLVQFYRDRNIVTDLDHRDCNNLCASGPHVVLGGRCQATPTPGTINYERVHSGPQQARRTYGPSEKSER